MKLARLPSSKGQHRPLAAFHFQPYIDCRCYASHSHRFLYQSTPSRIYLVSLQRLRQVRVLLSIDSFPAHLI